MDASFFKEAILEQKTTFESKPEGIVERDALEAMTDLIPLPHIIVVSGLRRSGKSTLLKQVRERFYPNETVFYFNFEDERLGGFAPDDFNLLFETFLETQGDSKTFFLDEVQNAPGWEAFVRRMHDRGFKFFITGSNSSLMSRELGTKLTGRYLPVELYPFSFAEFLRFKGISVPKHFLTEERGAIHKAFDTYLLDGGVPEYLRYMNPDILTSIYDNILYKDIIVRYRIGEEKAFRELAQYVISNFSNEIGITRLKDMLRLGSLNTVKDYLHYLENSYLLLTIPRFDHSVRKQIYSKKKAYVIDPGIINTVAFRSSKDTGRILENLVLVELKRRGKEVFYHQGSSECDFVVREKNRIVEAIQVTQGLTAGLDREIEGLFEAMDQYGLKEGLILTDSNEREMRHNGKKIMVKPIWKWLLEQ